MQISRLFQIIYILLEKGTTTAVELADRLEVSVRTIYRDIDAICQAGIPIYATQGKGGGIALMAQFVLDKSVLSESEQNEILIALQNLTAVHYPGADGILKKLGSLFSKSTLNWIEVDLATWGSDARQKETFSILKNAVLNKNIITFTYFNVAGEKSERRVEPVKLLFKDKSWYLKGFCCTKMASRTFKVTRMTNIQITDAIGTHDEIPETPAKAETDTPVEPVKLILKISPEGAYKVYDDFDEKNITRHADGSFTVTASMPGGDWIYSYLLSFGTVLEVIEPQNIRKEIARRLKVMMQNYLCET